MINDNQREQIVKFLDDQLNDQERLEVENLLRDDAAARTFLRSVAEHVVVFADTNQSLDGMPVGRSNSNLSSSTPNSTTQPKKLESPRRRTWGVHALVATAATLAVAASVVYTNWPEPPRMIARITEISGSVEWRGDGGRINRGLAAGDSIGGGTLDVLASDSWARIKFNDGSKVTVTGQSELTISDGSQKELHLTGGNLSANVTKQRLGEPMLIHTPTAKLEVLGTQLNVESLSTVTALSVNEGKVRMTRLVDGTKCDVSAQHVVVASLNDNTRLEPTLKRQPVNFCLQSMETEPKNVFGRWFAASKELPARLRTIPINWKTQDDKPTVLNVLVIRASEFDQPISLDSDAYFRVTGRARRTDGHVYFMVSGRHHRGGFAGKFFYGVDLSKVETTEQGWTIDMPLSDFKPELEDQETQSPVGLEMEEFSAVVKRVDVGLEVHKFELVPPSTASPEEASALPAN